MDELLTDTHIHIISAQMCIANAQEELEKLAALSLSSEDAETIRTCSERLRRAILDLSTIDPEGGNL